MKKLVIGNWKMNPTTLDETKRIYRSIKNFSKKLVNTDLIICPPFIYLYYFLNKTSENLYTGAQNVFFEDQGAYTGEVSIEMLRNFGIDYVIVGHSERRAMGETDEIVSKKIQRLLDLNMHPIMCIGEKERDPNGVYLEFLKNQIKNSLTKVQKKNIKNLIVAYEPLWAIGAKEAMNPRDIYEMSLFVKKTISDLFGHDEAISVPILYGGSVNFRNAADIIVQGQVNGLLVGRESVNPSNFIELLKAVDSL
jgi:triosephosphate isomerase